jgi:glutathione S-transferase
MITIHHLGVSQSDRIVWLMEELGLPYQLKWYHRRKEDNFAPAEYLALHPAATAPVITDGDRTIAESAAIVEYICHRYGGGRLTVRPEQAEYPEYLYWMHFNNNVLGLFFAQLALGCAEPGPKADRVGSLIDRRWSNYYRYMEQRLGQAPYLAGQELSCADIMCLFNLTSIPLFGGRGIDGMPNTQAYVRRISARPAYIKAMSIAGPAAKPPA